MRRFVSHQPVSSGGNSRISNITVTAAVCETGGDIQPLLAGKLLAFMKRYLIVKHHSVADPGQRTHYYGFRSFVPQGPGIYNNSRIVVYRLCSEARHFSFFP
jgi:hypothetical protein